MKPLLSTMPHTSCRCLRKIATSAFGLLAMTIRGQYHFNVSLYQSLVLRRAGLSPPLQRPTGSLVLTFHFPFPAFSLFSYNTY